MSSKIAAVRCMAALSDSKEGRGCAGGETKMFSSNYLYTTQLNYSAVLLPTIIQ